MAYTEDGIPGKWPVSVNQLTLILLIGVLVVFWVFVHRHSRRQVA